MRESVEFHAGVVLDGKAVREVDGDLIIEGIAANTSLDDQDEFFEGDALAKAAAEFMESPNRPLLYHHRPGEQLGEVLELTPVEGGALHMKARIDKPAPGSWAEDIYNKVARGTMKGLSVGGRFFRRLDAKGIKIHKARFREISVTPFPVNQETFGIVAQKAFTEAEEVEPETLDQLQLAIDGLNDTLDRL